MQRQGYIENVFAKVECFFGGWGLMKVIHGVEEAKFSIRPSLGPMTALSHN